MSIDDKIKRELEDEARHLDPLLIHPQGMVEMGIGAFKGGLGRWIVLIGIITLLVTIAMVWCGYQFVIATSVDDRVFWGVWLIVSLSAQIALKQWTWMEARRVSILREVKRVEVAVERLALKLQKQP